VPFDGTHHHCYQLAVADIFLKPGSPTRTRRETGIASNFISLYSVVVDCTNSFQNYTDYFKCISAKGEDYAPCKGFKRTYNSLCPSMLLSRYVFDIPKLLLQMNGYVSKDGIRHFYSYFFFHDLDLSLGRTTREWNVPGQPRTLEISIINQTVVGIT
jgi:hypothetical protein